MQWVLSNTQFLLVAIMIILGLLIYYACITNCGMHGVHCVCCKRRYVRYPAPENPVYSRRKKT